MREKYLCVKPVKVENICKNKISGGDLEAHGAPKSAATVISWTQGCEDQQFSGCKYQSGALAPRR